MPNTKYQKGFAKIDKVLNNTAKNYNLEEAMHRHQALKYWHDVATSFVEEAKALTKAVDFKKGVLTVACLSREVASKIKLLSVRIIESLNQILGRRLVFAIELSL
jgi:hypothetical protein